MLSSALAVANPATVATAKSIHPDYLLRRGEVQRFGDWLTACDNNAACTMIGFPGTLAVPEADPPAHDVAIQISWSGPAADSIPVVELVTLMISAAGSPAQQFVLNVEYDVAAISPPHGFSRHQLLPMEAIAVLEHLGHGKRLVGNALTNHKVIVRFPAAEFRPAFRALRSRREKLLEEANDKAIDELPGELPDGSTMPVAPKQYRRIPAVPFMVSGLAPVRSHGKCGHGFMQDMRDYRFADGTALWSYVCEGEAPPRTYWEMVPRAVAESRPLNLPEPRGAIVQAGSNGLENAIFDFDFGILRAYNYQQGREDCGTFRAWGFTTNGWQLIERREMPVCKGLAPADWIRTYYQPTDGAGPDE